ncbi:hypothetical protein WJX72_002272 [[Myrmecia] bisecta]|uniref:ATP synthase F0 subunit 8 n=1 Tax=[Myrmecia] bisecta TaxID=41462 RepID=A0AAW1P199_9CHLO
MRPSPDFMVDPVMPHLPLALSGSGNLLQYLHGAIESGILQQVLGFYLLILIGFLFLYLTWRSTTRVSDFRRQVVSVLALEAGRKFAPEEYSRLYGVL